MKLSKDNICENPQFIDDNVLSSRKASSRVYILDFCEVKALSKSFRDAFNFDRIQAFEFPTFFKTAL